MASRSHQVSAYYQLFGTLRSLYEMSFSQLTSPQELHGRNGPSFNGLSAFMLTVAVWESYLNFVFFSPWTKVHFGISTFEQMQALKSGLDKMSILEKSSCLPLIAFGKTFRKDAKPFQDLKDIVSIRNAATHNFMETAPEKAISAIRARGLLLPKPILPCESQSWDQELSTLEVIRWCMNTIGNLNEKLLTFPVKPSSSWRSTFGVFPPSYADRLIKKRFQA